jgi:CMP-N-acetylneuraminate monooxygenase
MSAPYYTSSSPIPYRIICHLSTSIIENLKVGLNFVNVSEIIRLLIYQNEDKSLIISRNLCRHAGGNFVHDIEDLPEIVRCSYHGWKLNTKTLEYIKPANSLKQKQLTIDKQDNGELIILEPLLYEPWIIDSEEKQDLKCKELTVCYINHSCVEIEADGRRLIIDPWLTGPCYGRSWWLFHEIEDDCFERIATADGIFISKYSPDHFNLPTLKRIAEINPFIQIYIPEIMIHLFKHQIEQLGFVNIRKIPFGIWEIFKSKESRFMILPDHKHPYIDIVFLFEYKGHRILNLVDCSNPNGEYLPYSIDVLLTNFTSNKNAFPVCFIEQFGEENILEMAKIKEENFIKKIIKFIQLSNPSLWIPIGGYFIEAGPGDEQIRHLNSKNNPSTVAERLKSRFPFLKTWCPFPGGKYDVGTKTVDQPSKPLDDYLKRSWNFQPYIYQLDRSMDFEPLKSMEGIKYYFQWTLFNNYDLVLHIIETTNDFSQIIREYYVDFIGLNPTFIDCVPADRPFLRIRIRASVIRDIFIRGYSWSYIFNGFSARFFAQPNIYHRKFWDYFKYNLPLDPPQWDQFNEQIPPNLLETSEQWEIDNKTTNHSDRNITITLNSLSL